MEALELNHRPTFRTNYLHPALDEGYIIPSYPEQPSHPKQKYRLTENPALRHSDIISPIPRPQLSNTFRLYKAFANNGFCGLDSCSDFILSASQLGGKVPGFSISLEKFGLQKDGILNNAAAVLFGKHDGMEYPQCTLRLARFKGTDKTVFMDSQRIQGNFFQLLNAAMAFIFYWLPSRCNNKSLYAVCGIVVVVLSTRIYGLPL